MNNDNNNFNNGQNTSLNDKFMPVSDINQINQPVNENVQQPAVPTNNIENTQPIPQPVEPTNVVVPPVQQVTPRTEIPPIVNNPQPQPDPNAMVNENLKKVEIKNYTPPSKFKTFLLVVFFILLIAFVIFLPEISSMVRIYMNGNTQPEVKEVITTGELSCTMVSNTTDLDKEYEFLFTFVDSKVKTSKYFANTRGDSTTEDSLNELSERCNHLKEITKDVEGFTVKCEYVEGKVMEKQTFDLEKLNTEKLDSEFTEAGGMLPTYNFDQDISEIETNMKYAGYTCERQK